MADVSDERGKAVEMIRVSDSKKEESASKPQGSAFMLEGSTSMPKGPAFTPKGSTSTPGEPNFTPEGLASMSEGPTFMPEGSVSMPQEPAFTPEGSASLPQGPTFTPEGSTSMPEGPASKPEGSTSTFEGSTSKPGGSGSRLAMKVASTIKVKAQKTASTLAGTASTLAVKARESTLKLADKARPSASILMGTASTLTTKLGGSVSTLTTKVHSMFGHSTTTDTSNHRRDVPFYHRMYRTRLCRTVTIATVIILFAVFIYHLLGRHSMDKGRLSLKQVAIQSAYLDPTTSMDTLSVKGNITYLVSFRKEGRIRPFPDFVIHNFTLAVYGIPEPVSINSITYKISEDEKLVVVKVVANQTGLTEEQMRKSQNIISQGHAWIQFSGDFKWHERLPRFLIYPYSHKHLRFTCNFRYIPGSTYENEHIVCQLH